MGDVRDQVDPRTNFQEDELVKFLLIAITCNAVANVMLKIVAASDAANRTVAGFLPGYVLHPLFIIGLMCFAGSMLSFTKTLTILPLSTAYPVLASVSYAAVIAVSVLVFRETLTWPQWSGLSLIVVGLVLLSRA